jgi:hypothetical protein
VQVDRLNPGLKASGTARLKLECDEVVSRYAINFNSRRYKVESETALHHVVKISVRDTGIGRGLHSSTSHLNLSRFCNINPPYTPRHTP